MLTRRLRVVVAAVLALAVGPAVRAAGPLQPNDFVAVIGDSITEQKLYSVFIEDYLMMCQPVQPVRTAQFGWSGDTTWGHLANKLENNVLRFHPTVVTTNFGMNDGAYNTLPEATATRYRQSTQTIIDKLKAGGVRTIVLGSPGCVDTGLKGKAVDYVTYNKTLGALRDIVKELAEKNGLLFADVFTPMSEIRVKAKEKYGAQYNLAGADGIHPQRNGHLVMAYAYLKAMGFDGNIGSFTVDMGAKTATASEGHKVVSSNGADVVIESSRYPFCFSGKPEDANATTGVLEFLPFNQELNRLTLTVKNAPAKVKVTWGKASKTFTAEELGKGINLAAEFLDNPFGEAFQKVEAGIRAQQEFETPFIKQFVVNVPAQSKIVPDSGSDFDNIIKKGVERDMQLHTTAASLVAPVRHTIHLEAAE